jgi:hypothetical protein
MDRQEKITVILKNNNSTLSTNQFEVYDNVGNAPVGTFTLKGGESISIEIGQDTTGKGSVKIRNSDLDQNDWVAMGSIDPGEVITA